ncbi:hypothetical protein EV174_006183, partial [Coemansia sp. RSA 2320]
LGNEQGDWQRQRRRRVGHYAVSQRRSFQPEEIRRKYRRPVRCQRLCRRRVLYRALRRPAGSV